YGGVIRTSDSKHADSLEIRAVIATRFDAGLLDFIHNVSGCEAKTFGECIAPFKLIGREVTQPAAQRLRRDRSRAAFGLRRRALRPQGFDRGDGAKQGGAEGHCQRRSAYLLHVVGFSWIGCQIEDDTTVPNQPSYQVL